MNIKKYQLEDFIKTYKKNNKNFKATILELGISERHGYRLKKQMRLQNSQRNEEVKNKNINIIKKDDTKPISIQEESKLELMKEKQSKLENELKTLKKELALKDEEIEGIWNIKNSVDYKGLGQPDWLDYNKLSQKQRDLSIPTLFCSDEHWGEVVFKRQVNNVNEYSTVIARKRYNNIINNYLDVVDNHLQAVDKERMVLLLGGDNVSGDIHDELSNTNDMTTMESVLDYVEHKKHGIQKLLEYGYKKIFIACVSGNHDRNTHKIQNKNRNETSFAFIIYRFLQQIFANDKRVVFSICSGLDLLYKVYNHKYLLTHGDQFKGGNGVGGITVPILRGFNKKLANLNATGNNFDSMVIGHFHQFTSILNGQVIINGSLKGFDEYSQAMNFGYQQPCQAFWLTHPERGITIQLPIYAENNQQENVKEFNKSDWVSWKA